MNDVWGKVYEAINKNKEVVLVPETKKLDPTPEEFCEAHKDVLIPILKRLKDK